MNIKSDWKNVTRTQLGQVAPPHPGTARRLEKTDGYTAGEAYTSAQDHRETASYAYSGCLKFGIGATVVGAGASALLASNGYTGLAAAAGCLGGAVALGAGYFAVTNRSEVNAWGRFQNELQTWSTATQETLVRPGATPGTEENHNFFEAGSLKSLCDVRQNNVVVARHADLTSGVKLSEDVAAQTVTAESVAGTQVFPRASLTLPTGGERDRAVQLKTWSDDGAPVVQYFSADGSSYVAFGKRPMGIHVFPQTQMDYQYQNQAGVELPGRIVRFEYNNNQGEYNDPSFDVFYAHPPLSGRDFKADFPLATEALTSRDKTHGKAIFRSAPAAELKSLETLVEPMDKALQTRRLPLAEGVEMVDDVASGQVSVVKGEASLQTRPGVLNLTEGTLTEKQGKLEVVQDLKAYPQVSLKVGDVKFSVDTNDNLTAHKGYDTLPSRLIDGQAIEFGTGDKAQRFEIPVPRKAW